LGPYTLQRTALEQHMPLVSQSARVATLTDPLLALWDVAVVYR